MIAFGPVPSRRLGKSMGVNNIPPKHCTYSCLYCQVGRTRDFTHERRQFYTPEKIFDAAKEKMEKIRDFGEPVDYITFVADGEPTLDINLGQEIRQLKSLGVKIAVITNASLMQDQAVQDELSLADWVSLKVDAVHPKIWRRIDRPHRSLNLKEIHEGMLRFSKNFAGHLVTETMLLKDVNDDKDHLTDIADFLNRLNPDISYIAIPTRPPAEKRVFPATEEAVNLAYQIFSQKISKVEYLIGYEGNEFAFTGDIRSDILSITAVHPMSEEAMDQFLIHAHGEISAVEELMDKGELKQAEYNGIRFYIRSFA